MAVHKMVQNDTAPDITKKITIDGSSDLTGATVRFKIKDPDAERTNDAHSTCAFVGSPTLGTVKYSFVAGDIPAATTYLCDWEVTLASGKVWTAYQAEQLQVREEA